MKNQTILVLVILFLIPLAAGQSMIFAQNEDVNFRFRCLNDSNQYCSSGTQLLLSVEDPNGSNAIDNSSMTSNPTFFNHSLPTATVGTYSAIVISPTAVNTSSEFTYLVTPNGQQLSTSQAILYIFILAIGSVFFLLSLFGAIVIPFRHKRDAEGFIIEMNDLKYVKIFLWFFTYILAIFISFIARSVTGGYLFIDTAALFFKWIYLFLLAFLFPVVVIFVVVGFVNLMGDKGIFGAMDRGLRIK